MNCRMEPIQREQVIAKYLSRALDADAVEEFEGHYLGCDECFDELRLSKRMAAELRRSNLTWKRNGGISVLQFSRAAELTHSADELDQLRREVLEQSAGLGQLMSCYSHLVRNQGSLKVVNVTPEVKKVMDMTGISSLIRAFSNEQEAVKSFN